MSSSLRDFIRFNIPAESKRELINLIGQEYVGGRGNVQINTTIISIDAILMIERIMIDQVTRVFCM